MRRTLALLVVAWGMVATAVMIRLWLAATGGYSHSDMSMPLRIVSAMSLVGGLALAAVAAVWPVRRRGEKR